MLTFGCLKPPLTPPSQGGAGWQRLETKHFDLASNLDAEQAERVIASFEEIYDLLGLAVFGRSVIPEVHTSAVIFEQRQELRQFYGDAVGGIYFDSLSNDLEATPTLVTYGTLDPYSRVTFAHELTHRFNHFALGPTPLWLNEGLANYYSTIRGQDGEPVVGETDPRYMCASGGVQQAVGDIVCNYEVLRASTLPPIDELLGYERSEFYRTSTDPQASSSYDGREKTKRNYAAAWLLVHMLQHSEHDYAQKFRRLMQGPASQHKGAQLAELVRAVPKARLQADFDDYRRKTIPWREHHAQLPSRPGDLQSRSMKESEVRVLWARLDDFTGPSASRARTNLDAAREASEAGDGTARFWLGRYHALRNETDEAESAFQDALRTEPQVPEYLLGLIDLLWGHRGGAAWADAARSPQVGKLIAELEPIARTARQHNAVAVHRLMNEDVPDALEHSKRACELGPDCWQCFHNRASALFAAGQREEAAAAERTALDRLPERIMGNAASAMQKALDLYTSPQKPGPNTEIPGLIAP